MPDIDLLSLVGLSLGGLSLFRFFPLFRADVTLFEVLGALRGALLVALRETLFLDELLVEQWHPQRRYAAIQAKYRPYHDDTYSFANRKF